MLHQSLEWDFFFSSPRARTFCFDGGKVATNRQTLRENLCVLKVRKCLKDHCVSGMISRHSKGDGTVSSTFASLFITWWLLFGAALTPKQILWVCCLRLLSCVTSLTVCRFRICSVRRSELLFDPSSPLREYLFRESRPDKTRCSYCRVGREREEKHKHVRDMSTQIVFRISSCWLLIYSAVYLHLCWGMCKLLPWVSVRVCVEEVPKYWDTDSL